MAPSCCGAGSYRLVEPSAARKPRHQTADTAMTRKTAEQLLAELEADPAWRAQRDARAAELAARAAVLAAEEAQLVAEIRAVGYAVESVYDLVNNDPHPFLTRRFVGPYPVAYPVLLRHLKVAYSRPIREGIIRALTVKDGGAAVEEALLRAFQAESDSQLRWVLANALRTAMPYHRRKKHPAIAEALRWSTSSEPPTAS